MQKRLKEILDDLSNIETRASEIGTESETADEAAMKAMNTELDEMEQRKSALMAEKAEIETKEKEARDLEAGKINGTPIEMPKMEERKMEKVLRDSKEYRDAFWATMQGTGTVEQRDALITTANGIELPTAIETQIWDLIHDAHPILEDITLFSTGTILVVNQHTAITAGKAAKKAEGVANDVETNTFAKVTLSGNDYVKTVELSYAESKMSQGALEQYLATEIAADLGEAMAKDVFAQMKTDIGAAAVTVALNGNLTYKNLLTAFGAASRATTRTVYASSENVFGEIYGMVDTNGQPVIRDGVLLGATLKIDSAAGTDMFVVDSKNFEANMIQPVMIESERDIKTHKIVYSGYARMQGCMRDVKAGAYIAKAAA